MKSNLALAINFAEQIKKIKHILQIIVFGSVARGEDTRESDIDIAVIYDSEDRFKFMEEVNRDKPERIQTTFVNITKLPEETELISALSGEGLLLYGQPITIKERRLDLKARTILSYDLSGLPQTEKVKLDRALYGSVSRSTFKGREYKTETKGLTKEPGIEKINKGVLLVERRKATKIIGLFKRFRVRFREIPVWSY